jgi:hypothetical protein
LLLGLPNSPPPKREPIKAAEICQEAFQSKAFGKWVPSPDSLIKQRALMAIESEVKRQSNYFGVLRSAICNDFNVDDPEVFAIAGIVDKSGKSDQLFIYMSFNGRSGKCSTNHVETRDFPRSLMDNVRRQPINLNEPNYNK